MNTAILTSTVLSAIVCSFALLIIYKHVRDVLAWREQALMACKQARMRQELVRYVADRRETMIRAC